MYTTDEDPGVLINRRWPLSSVTDLGETVADIADDKQLAAALAAVLDADRGEVWEFDDVPIDSGEFGELVDRGVIVSVDGGYRLADPEVVATTLDGEAVTDDTESGGIDFGSLTVPVSTQALTLLCGALLLVVLARTVPAAGSVFRDGAVVLSGNDPYYYRTLVDQLLVADEPSTTGAWARVSGDDFLFVVTLWAASSLVGSSGGVFAVYPVVMAVVSTTFVYGTTVTVAGDRRVGLAAVTLLAFVPVHAFRTSLGFADHHSFDYLALAATLYGLVVLLTRDRARFGGRSVTAGLVLAAGVTVQALAWRGGPLYLLPLAVVIPVVAALDLQAERDPVRPAVLAAFGGAAACTAVVATVLGLQTYRWLVVALVAAGAGLTAGVARVVAARDHGWWVFPAVVGGTIAVVGLGVVLAVPSVTETLGAAEAYFGSTTGSSIAETRSLFAAGTGVIVTPLLFFGLVFPLLLGTVVWAAEIARQTHDPGVAVVATYTLVFLAFAAVQVRFSGPLAVVAAPLVGYGFLLLAAWTDMVAESPGHHMVTDSRRLPSVSLPDRQTASALLLLFLLVSGLGMVQTWVKIEQVTIEDDIYQTAVETRAYADENGIDDSYVLSEWGRNRVYNYVVGGEGMGFGYAREVHTRFVRSTDPGRWADQLSGQVRFVVTGSVDSGDRTMHARLHDNHGSDADGRAGLGRYRLVSVADGGGRKVFEFVPGALVTGVGPSNETVVVTRNVTVSGRTVTYRRVVETNRYGDYSVRLPYTGSYDVFGQTSTVERTAVLNGDTVGRHRAHITFDDGQLREVFHDDPGRVSGAATVAGVAGDALRFDGNDDARVENVSYLNRGDSFTVVLWARGLEGGESEGYGTLVSKTADSGGRYQLMEKARSDTIGVRLVDTDGQSVAVYGVASPDEGNWTQVAAVVDRSAGELRLYADGTLVGVESIADLDRVLGPGPLQFGTRNGNTRLTGTVDEFRLYDGVVTAEELQRKYKNISSSEPRR